MSVGQQADKSTIDQQITAYSVALRNACQAITNLSVQVNGQGSGLTYLENIGYSNTANSENPGGISDAQLAENLISYLNTVAALYFGTAAQTPAFNFNQELSQTWAGQ
jgi:hypothetical protein